MSGVLSRLITVGTFSLAAASAVQGASVSPDDYIRWLPADTETVIVAKGPFQIEESSPPAAPSSSFADLRSWPFGVILRDLLIPEVFSQLLGKTVLLAVEGARNFRAPTLEGLMRYDGCHIINFESSFDIPFAALVSLGASSGTGGGRTVVAFEKKNLGDHWRTHFALLDSNLLLICTDRTYLDELVERRRIGAVASALSEFSRWELVDRTKPFWAVRQFARSDAARDPTNPTGAAVFPSLGPQDSQAEGLAIEADASGIVYKYFSNHAEALALQESVWALVPNVRAPVAPLDGFGARVTPQASSAAGARFVEVLLLGRLGHGLIL